MGHKMKVDPDAVRQAATGEAWVITNGRAAHLIGMQARIPAEVREHARPPGGRGMGSGPSTTSPTAEPPSLKTGGSTTRPSSRPASSSSGLVRRAAAR